VRPSCQVQVAWGRAKLTRVEVFRTAGPGQRRLDEAALLRVAQSRKRPLTEQDLGFFDEARRHFEARCFWHQAPTLTVEGNRAVPARPQPHGDRTVWRLGSMPPARMLSDGFQKRGARVPGPQRWYLDDVSGQRRLTAP
jgi:hypothetical protein